jgi:phosphotransacetylase
MNRARDRLGDLLAGSTGGTTPRTPVVAVAGANSPEIIESIGRAISTGIARFSLIGPPAEIEETARARGVRLTGVRIVPCAGEQECCALASTLAATGEADVLMKGLVQTATFIRSVLHADPPLIEAGGLISHVAVADVPVYHKLLLLTDAAINVTPSVDQRIQLIRNALPVVHSLGIRRPKIACVSPVEKISERVVSTGESAEIVRRVEAGEATGVEIAGPFGLDVALSRQAAGVKSISGTVAGDADLLLVPNLDTGNAIYKSLTVLAGARIAGVVGGARIPIILTSRADSEHTKFASIRLAVAGALHPEVA